MQLDDGTKDPAIVAFTAAGIKGLLLALDEGGQGIGKILVAARQGIIRRDVDEVGRARILFFNISGLDEQLDPIQYLGHSLTGNGTDFPTKIFFVHGENLSNIDDTLFCQICLALLERYIARGLRPLQIRCQ